MDNLADDLKELDVFIGKRLREKRHKLGLTLVQVGKDVGMSHQQIQKYEKAKNRISASRLFELAQILKKPVSSFFEDLTADRSYYNYDFETDKKLKSVEQK